jgi:hypothetical protein
VEVNQSGKCEGPGGGDRRGALCTGFTLVFYYYNKLLVCSSSLDDTRV